MILLINLLKRSLFAYCASKNKIWSRKYKTNLWPSWTKTKKRKEKKTNQITTTSYKEIDDIVLVSIPFILWTAPFLKKFSNKALAVLLFLLFEIFFNASTHLLSKSPDWINPCKSSFFNSKTFKSSFATQLTPIVHHLNETKLLHHQL